MATAQLTARSVAGAKATSRTDIYDEAVPGLMLRVTPTGAKSWAVLFRHRGRKRKFTIGRYPDVTLADAREVAREIRAKVRLGGDPVADRHEQRRRDADTLRALFEAYEKKAQAKRSWHTERRVLEVNVIDRWGHRPVSDISRKDVRALVEEKAETAPVLANRLLSHLSAMFRFAVDREWIDSNPAYRIPKPTQEQSRDRVLTPVELRELWQALHETEIVRDGTRVPRLSETLNDAFVTILATAQRCGEVCRMRWADVDLETGWWSIPGAMTKNGSDHRVPLADWLVERLAHRLQKAAVNRPFVFSNRKGTSVAGRAKKAASLLSGGLSFRFRAHDLRRTAASNMAQAGVPRDHIAHVLNHRSVTHSTVTAIYDRYTYDREKRGAIEQWSRSLASTVAASLTEGRVVRFPAASGRATSR